MMRTMKTIEKQLLSDSKKKDNTFEPTNQSKSSQRENIFEKCE